jgi:hypothetical protein
MNIEHMRSRSLFIAGAALILIATSTSGAPQNGGGGGGGTGGGTIYYIDTGRETNYLWGMGSDGSNKTEVGKWGYFNTPSRTPHAGFRWYLTTLSIPGSYYPDGVTLRFEVFAIREDFDPTLNNNPETRVQLTNNATLQPVFGWFQGMHWMPGDNGISFKARRWSEFGVVEGGLYTAQLEYGLDGGIIGLATQPSAPTVAFPLSSDGWPTFNTHSWGPTGRKVVYTDNPTTGLWVADLDTNTRTRIYTSTAASYPDWSPDGTKIAFSTGPGEPVSSRSSEGNTSTASTGAASPGPTLMPQGPTSSALDGRPAPEITTCYERPPLAPL